MVFAASPLACIRCAKAPFGASSAPCLPMPRPRARLACHAVARRSACHPSRMWL